MPEFIDKGDFRKQRPEKEKKVPIAEQQMMTVAKANELIQKSRYSMTAQQNKIMLYLISKIKPNDTGDEEYKFSISEFCKVCNIDYNGKNMINIKAALQAIADKSVWVTDEHGNDILLRWLDTVHIMKASGNVEIRFHRDMFPFLFDLRREYTSYILDNILLFESKYSIRLYELLKSYEYMKKDLVFSIDELKYRLDIDKYSQYYDIKRKVLDIAIKEINAYTDIQVSYEPYQKDGNKVASIKFTISRPNIFAQKIRDNKKRQGLLPEPDSSSSAARVKRVRLVERDED